MDTRPLRFFHRGAVRSVDGVAPTRSVLDWLREDAACTGTKEGCAEGDCGACTVLVGALDDHDALVLKPVNACLQFLPMLDGRALVTVEDLKAGPQAPLHPVQQAMVACHGSQCGFCTPGFVMSMAGVYEAHLDAGTRPTRGEWADALAGNLCRCTGYRPILDAGERLFDLPVQRLDTAPAIAALRTLRDGPPLAYAATNPATGETEHFHAPRSVDDFAERLVAEPDARVLGGATDVGLWVTKQFRALPALVSIAEVGELKRIDRVGDTLVIGAAATLEDAWSALAREVPSLREVWLRFASPPLRHAGTLGGNIANGSPIGDGAPVLMALGARVRLRRGTVQRTLALDDFYLGYMKNALAPGEFVEALDMPLPGPRTAVRAYKLSKRYDSDISAVCAALSLTLHDDGHVADCRFAFGGMAATVQRARQAEAAVRGRAWDEAAVQAAQAALGHDYTPLTDQRASAGYRLRAAQNLLRRLWLETRPHDALAPDATSVWAGLVAPRAPAPSPAAP